MENLQACSLVDTFELYQRIVSWVVRSTRNYPCMVPPLITYRAPPQLQDYTDEYIFRTGTYNFNGILLHWFIWQAISPSGDKFILISNWNNCKIIMVPYEIALFQSILPKCNTRKSPNPLICFRSATRYHKKVSSAGFGDKFLSVP